jgi:hypothetical protein
MTNDSHDSWIQCGVDFLHDGMSQTQKYLSEMDLSIILGPNVVQGYACFRNGECHELLGELIPGWVHQLHGYIPTSIAAWIITLYIVYHIYMTITHSGVRYRNGVDDTNKTARIQDILASLQRQFYTHEAREKATENHKKPGPQLYGAAPLTRAPPIGVRCTCGAECCIGWKVQSTPVAKIAPTKIRPQYKSLDEWKEAKKRVAAIMAAKEGTN